MTAFAYKVYSTQKQKWKSHLAEMLANARASMTNAIGNISTIVETSLSNTYDLSEKIYVEPIATETYNQFLLFEAKTN